MTSWSDSELEQLSSVDNHKVIKDIAGEYRWMHKLNGKWSVHSIKIFENESTPLAWMYMWLTMWSDELKSRREAATRKLRRERKRINRSTRLTIKEKAKALRTLLPDFTQQELANEVGVGIATVKRYLKQ